MAPSTAREHVRVALRLRECPRVHARMAELIIGRPFARILEDLVSLLGFLESLMRCGVIRIPVRMELHRQAAIGFFQLIVTGRLFHAEDFVVIPFCHADCWCLRTCSLI